MRFLLVAIAFSILAAPLPAEASKRLYEKWEFRTEADINSWNYTGLDEGILTTEGLEFDVTERAVMYRELPKGFHRHVDALRIRYDAGDLEEVAILFLKLHEEDQKIELRYRLSYPVEEEGPVSRYIPLSLYTGDIRGTDVLAVSYKGDSPKVSFDSVRFLHYTFLEKIAGAWKSFWSFEGFEPFTINIMHGPMIVTDIGALKEDGIGWQSRIHSVNAYILVGLSLFGVGFLFWGFRMRLSQGWSWQKTHRKVLLIFAGAVAAVWIFYDARMGAEFVRNVMRDHMQYVAAESSEREFRDMGNFYDFIGFAKPFLTDHMQYEVFLYSRWPHAGVMRYYTYPAKPNQDDPVSDIWLVYDRDDVSVSQDGSLIVNNNPFTEPGEMLGRFDENSFVYRAAPL